MKSNLRCRARHLNKNVGWVEAIAETQRIQNNLVGVRFAHPNLRATAKLCPKGCGQELDALDRKGGSSQGPGHRIYP